MAGAGGKPGHFLQKFKMKKHLLFFFLLISVAGLSNEPAPGKNVFVLRIYRLKTAEQLRQVHSFLQNAYLPALHRLGIHKVGVFQPLANDTAIQKSVYVLVPFESLNAWNNAEERLKKDAVYLTSAHEFIAATIDRVPYDRMETVLLDAFSRQPGIVTPAQQNPERIFELRSYESPTEDLHKKKVNMFETGEIDIFDRLGFRSVFYARAISGSRMPNLMYMPAFDNMAAHDSLWKKFGADPKWKEMSALPENENKISVSHIESILMHSMPYSDY